MRGKLAVTSKTVLEQPEIMAYLQSRLGHDYSIIRPNTVSYPLVGEDMFSVAKDCLGLLIGREPLTEEVLKRLPRLKIASVYGVGVDNIDFLACQRYGVSVVESPGINRHAVAEFVVGLGLGLLRRIHHGDRNIRNNLWKKDGGVQLQGKKVGIVGLGAVGSAVGSVLRCFDCKLSYFDIRNREDVAAPIDAKALPLDALLDESDIVSLHVPLTPLTYQFFDRSLITRMRRGAYLINTSRGEVLETEALLDSLADGHLAGAALDVFAAEPQIDQRLIAQPNLILTPHIAGNARECVLSAGYAAVDRLAEGLAKLC